MSHLSVEQEGGLRVRTHSNEVLNPHDSKRVLVIYTGGTAGMKRGEDGSLVPVPGYLTEQVNNLPEFHGKEMPAFLVKEWETLIDSSDISPAEWAQLAKEIEEHYLDYDGFVVLHGTDTMAYTASALSFMLENLGKPVVITGSQVPFEEVYNDCRRNLTVAMLYAADFDIPEVCIFFDNVLLRGNRSCKTDALGLHAFTSPNCPPLGTLDIHLTLNSTMCLSQPKKRLRVFTHFDTNVGILRLTPGFSDKLVENFVQEPMTGLVLEMYGVGNSPSSKAGLTKALTDAVNRGVIIVIISQCKRGYVNLNLYKAGSTLRELGAVSGSDMTPETAATKLAWLLGQKKSAEEVKKLMMADLRGELTVSRL
eukprot:Nk52_evm5s368 gene=Nk52_evmTU5s368